MEYPTKFLLLKTINWYRRVKRNASR